MILRRCPRNWSRSLKLLSVSEKNLTTLAEHASDDDAFGFTSADMAKAKPFESIPTPTTVPFFGNLFSFKPFGKLDAFNRPECCKMMRETFGPIVKISLPFMKTLPTSIEILDPKDFEIVFRNEGRYPVRPEDPAFYKYRLKRKQELGLLLSNHEQWWALRKPLNKVMMKANSAHPYLEVQSPIGDELVVKIQGLIGQNNENRLPSLMAEFSRWSFESVCAVVFDRRLGCLDSNLSKESWQQQFIESVQGAFSEAFSLAVNPMYNIFDRLGIPSRKQSKFDRDMDFVTEMSIQLVEDYQKKCEFDTNLDLSKRFLPQLLSIENLPMDQKITLIFDMMLAAIETTSYSLTYNLFYLAKNPSVQEKLQKEIDENFKSFEERVTPTLLSRMHYLKAVMRETYRLKPIIPMNVRNLIRDVVIQGYRIPKGTTCLLEHEYACLSEENYDNPLKFKPERWLRSGGSQEERGNPFLVMPFGFGPRMCIGRRFAEQELYIGIIKLLQAFRFDYDGDKLPLKGVGFDKYPISVPSFRIYER